MNISNVVPVRVSSLSTTYVKCRLSAKANGVPINPTSGTVAFAFLPESDNNSQPASGDWVAGAWETAPDGYWGKCLVGLTGTVTLATGSYDVWVRLTKSPEVVVDAVGVLSIY